VFSPPKFGLPEFCFRLGKCSVFVDLFRGVLVKFVPLYFLLFPFLWFSLSLSLRAVPIFFWLTRNCKDEIDSLAAPVSLYLAPSS
jgi:hypothetical protein